MDERAQQAFKYEFIKLTLLLNAIVLFVAMAVFIFIRFPEGYGRAVTAALLLLAVILFIVFSRLYARTKLFLEEHQEPAAGAAGQGSPPAGDEKA